MKKFIVKVYKAELKMVRSIAKFVKRFFKYGPKGAVCFAVAESSTGSKIGGLMNDQQFERVSCLFD